LFGGKKPVAPNPEAVYTDLRDKALGLTPETVGVTGDAVYAVILDMGFGEGTTATIFAAADGTASMYTSTGGGVIGAGQRHSVASVSKALVAEAERSRSLLSPGWDDTPLGDGEVRLIALAAPEALAASGSGDSWIADGSPMQPLFAAANDLIYQIRTASAG
jgi:hypothetical protein